MNKVFNKLIMAFWIFDIMNLPFMEIFDTTYPINFWAYLIVFSLWGIAWSCSLEVSNNRKGNANETD